MVLEKRRGGTVGIFSSKRVGYYNHIQILSHDPQTNPLTADENCESFDIPSILNLRCVSVLFVVVLGHPNGVGSNRVHQNVEDFENQKIMMGRLGSAL